MMKILFCNPKNSQGTTHSRNGMYVPLGILSISTILKEKFGDSITKKGEDASIDNLSTHLVHVYALSIVGWSNHSKGIPIQINVFPRYP